VLEVAYVCCPSLILFSDSSFFITSDGSVFDYFVSDSRAELFFDELLTNPLYSSLGSSLLAF